LLLGTGHCNELIIRPEESYRLWRVVLCVLSRNLENEEALAHWGGGGFAPPPKKSFLTSDYSLIYKEQKDRNLLLLAVSLSSLRATAMTGSRVVLYHYYERKCKVCKVPSQDVLHAVHVAFDKNWSNTEPPVQNTKQKNTLLYPREGHGQTHNPCVLAS
jgi:hypothetical protein